MSLRLIKKGGPFRLFCYPYAGGSAVSFSPLVRFLPDEFEAYGPNPAAYDRERGAPADYGEALERCLEDLLPLLRPPYALLGYSLGGLFVHDLLWRLRETGKARPELAVIAAAVPPTRMDAARKNQGWFEMEDREIVDSLVRGYGLSKVLARNASFLSASLPIYRADSRVFHTYPLREIRPTTVPTLVFSGDRDSSIPAAAALEWLALGPRTRVEMLDAGHMFLASHGERMAGAIRAMACRVDWASSEDGRSRWAGPGATPLEQ